MVKRATGKRRRSNQADDGYWEPLPRIAYLFELSEERVRQFVKAGVFERREDGMLDLRFCLHMYANFLRYPTLFRE